MSPATIGLLGTLAAAVVAGLFSVALLFFRRGTEREQLNSVVLADALKMAQEHRTERAEDKAEIASLKDDCAGMRRDLVAAEARAEHAEAVLRDREAADVLTNQLIDRLRARVAELEGE